MSLLEQQEVFAKTINVLLTKPSILSEYLAEHNIQHQTVKMFDYRRTASLVFLRQILTSDQYDLVILSSPAAIDIYLECDVANKVACISPSSAQKLSHLQPLYLTHKPYDGQALAQLIIKHFSPNTRILILSGVDGQNTMFENLAHYYTTVKKLEIYERICPQYDRQTLEDIFYHNFFDVMVATCNTAIKNLLYYKDKYFLRFNHECNLIVPSSRVAEYAKEHNFKHIIIADSVEDRDLLTKILAVKL